MRSSSTRLQPTGLLWEGEFLSFLGGVASVSSNCNAASGVATFSIQPSGTFAGTYPGAFEESGVAVYDNLSAGPVPTSTQPRSLNVRFTIDSVAGEVVGRKTLKVLLPPFSAGSAVCFPGGTASFTASADFVALIRNDTGTCKTEGSSDLSGIDRPADADAVSEGFRESTPCVAVRKQDCDGELADFFDSKKQCKDFIKDKGDKGQGAKS